MTKADPREQARIMCERGYTLMTIDKREAYMPADVATAFYARRMLGQQFLYQDEMNRVVWADEVADAAL